METHRRVWRAEKVPNDFAGRWMVVSDDGFVVGTWYDFSQSARIRADWENAKEAVYELRRGKGRLKLLRSPLEITLDDDDG